MRAFFYQPNVLVIKTSDVEKAKSFFETLGLKFLKEKHGEGPEHYATPNHPGLLSCLEIYPEK
jgi:catechol 2,3-dioxygenase-like lactoylglutathione lyase family enzyme